MGVDAGTTIDHDIPITAPPLTTPDAAPIPINPNASTEATTVPPPTNAEATQQVEAAPKDPPTEIRLVAENTIMRGVRSAQEKNKQNKNATAEKPAQQLTEAEEWLLDIGGIDQIMQKSADGKYRTIQEITEDNDKTIDLTGAVEVTFIDPNTNEQHTGKAINITGIQKTTTPTGIEEYILSCSVNDIDGTGRGKFDVPVPYSMIRDRILTGKRDVIVGSFAGEEQQIARTHIDSLATGKLPDQLPGDQTIQRAAESTGLVTADVLQSFIQNGKLDADSQQKLEEIIKSHNVIGEGEMMQLLDIGLVAMQQELADLPNTPENQAKRQRLIQALSEAQKVMDGENKLLKEYFHMIEVGDIAKEDALAFIDALKKGDTEALMQAIKQGIEHNSKLTPEQKQKMLDQMSLFAGDIGSQNWALMILLMMGAAVAPVISASSADLK